MNPMTETEYLRNLLRFYADHVGKCEGVDFIYDSSSLSVGQRRSASEWQPIHDALREISPLDDDCEGLGEELLAHIAILDKSKPGKQEEDDD